jgi:hypothetical protein
MKKTLGFTVTLDFNGGIVEKEITPDRHDVLEHDEMRVCFLVQEKRADRFRVTIPGDSYAPNFSIEADGKWEDVLPSTWAKLADTMINLAADTF